MDSRDAEGMTPLAYAVTCEHEKEVELLVRFQFAQCVFVQGSNLCINRE